MTQGNDAFCPKCQREKELLEMTQEHIQEIVSSLKDVEDKTVSKQEYERRLGICQNCSDLKDKIMCGWCGCYVALRARAIESYCPYPQSNKWKES